MRVKAGLISATLISALVCLGALRAPAGVLRAQDVLQAQDNGNKRLPIEEDDRFPGSDVPGWAKEKQKKAILHAKLASAERDATEMAILARQVSEELNKPDFKTLSPECVDRLNKIEKLAKKIRDGLKAY